MQFHFSNLDLDGLREQRKASEDIIGHLKKERGLISLQVHWFDIFSDTEINCRMQVHDQVIK